MQFQLRVPEGFRGRIYTHKVVVVAVAVAVAVAVVVVFVVVFVVVVVVVGRIYTHKVTN